MNFIHSQAAEYQENRSVQCLIITASAGEGASIQIEAQCRNILHKTSYLHESVELACLAFFPFFVPIPKSVLDSTDSALNELSI